MAFEGRRAIKNWIHKDWVMQPSQERPRLTSIQALRGIAALMVVLFHLRIVEGKYGAGAEWLPTFTRFLDSGVDLFFVISGFVMVSITAGYRRSAAGAGRFLVRRAWRILPPYWFYTTVVVMLMAVAPGVVNSSYGEQSILASYMLWPHAELPILTVGWTLIHEMFFYLVMAFVLWVLPSKRLPLFLLGWAGATVMAQWLPAASATPWGRVVLSPMSLEFIGGAMAGLYWHRLGPNQAWACLLVGIIGFCVAVLALDRFGPEALTPGLRTLLFGSTGVLVVAGAVALEAAGRLSLPAWLLAIGDSSYSFYLSHVFVLSAVGRLWWSSDLNQTPVQHAALILFAVLASVVVARMSFCWLERPLLLWGSKRRPLSGKPQPVRAVAVES